MEPLNNQENWESIVGKLNSTERDGVSELIKWLDATDFRIAPASTKFHLCVEGGLMQHSLNVLQFARNINSNTKLNLPDSSLILTSILHDLCKVNYYTLGEEWDKEWKDKTNQWRKKSVWLVDDKEPLGHGEKSAIVSNKYIELTTAELAAIRWHMGFSEPGVHFGYPTGHAFRDSLNQYPIVKVIMMADQMAEMYESVAEKREEG